MTQYPDPLPQAEFATLHARARAGDAAARNRIVSHNMRLVVTRARRLARVSGHHDLFDDFVQAGAVGSENEPTGLLRAIELFDPTRGYTFSTFARAWIDAAMLGVLAARTPVAPISRSELSKRILIRRVAVRLERELRRVPSADEVRAEFVRRGGYVPSLACVRRYCQSHAAVTGTEREANEDIVRNIDEAPAGVMPVDEQLANHQAADALRAALAQLSAIERRVIAGRFGLEDSDTATLRELGDALDLSRERVRQIEAGAMRKLRKLMGDASAQ